MFSEIPNKVRLDLVPERIDVWPEVGERCEVNLFYQKYDSAEGWIGEGYLMIWRRNETIKLGPVIANTFPEKYKFFGSDGGGNQFAFFDENGEIVYISAPDIGGEEDIRVLGGWREFVESIKSVDYI